MEELQINGNFSKLGNFAKDISEFKEFSIDGFRCFSARLTNRSFDYYIGYVAFGNEYSTAVDLAIENSGELPEEVEITWEKKIPPILKRYEHLFEGLIFLGVDLNHMYDREKGVCLDEKTLHYELKTVIEFVKRFTDGSSRQE